VAVLDLFRLSGRTALVTGHSRGIGRSLAVALAEAGADIVGVSRSVGGDEAVEHRLASLGRSFRRYSCDLGVRSEVHALVERVLSDIPRIDILVNNAGINVRFPATEYPDDAWDRVLHTDLTAQFILARDLGRPMVERGEGKIIFTASMLSFQGGVTVPAYAAAKGGVAQLTKALANEWAGRGVQVNAIAPGYFATDNTEALRADAARNDAISARIPAGRWGDPDDLKGAIVFLASAASDYVNGSVLVVDGGWLAR
jgi:2-deoxy-D-gluconate 3-dehydrogenase